MSTRRQSQQLSTLADAAARYEVSVRTLRRWISAGRITGYRFGPRAIRVDLAELDDLLSPIPSAGGAL